MKTVEIDDAARFPLFCRVRESEAVYTYIEAQKKVMEELGYTEHGFAHVKIVADRTAYILDRLDEDDHTIDLAITAAWLHDIGNIVNRDGHSQSGALMAFRILSDMNFKPEDIVRIVCAIGNHDEGNGVPVNRISAALILADKSDVRRSRVQQADEASFDLHDKVNYSVTESMVRINKKKTGIKLKLHIDTKYGEIGEYFEFFMERMLLCEKAAACLGLDFHLIINEMPLL